MELFDEVKNRYFQLVFRIINECVSGKTKDEILKIIDEGEFEQKVIGKNQCTFADLVLNTGDKDNNFNLLKQENDLFFPCLRDTGKRPLPIRFTNLEKAWLKALLSQPGIEMILSDETLAQLQTILRDIDTPLKKDYLEMTNIIQLPEISQPDIYQANFRLLLEALIQEKPIRYDNQDRKGNLHKNKLAVPVSLEYSMRDGRFRISMFSLDDNRPVMANLFTLSNLRIVNEKVPIDRETARALLYEKYSQEPIVLEVTDKKGAMERSFMCFSGMERSAKHLGNNKYELQLHYYLFEEENLIRSIISLGPYVKVTSPQRIADEIISRVRKSLEFATR
ncbi:WYL domain-containing protein [Desulfosporosinus youngiae]|uniref:Putative transcriptional regulator n=1 Tax=Desulfosporosinus youngiae DSM 17734 TaxID=768710 RepID=H5XVA2_9FIRM|nr:WYL domain-containing protein [Desulfosporosinus youngiae]EHQ89838.1 putative transcriptional regulator [Desulfosporosinus youngiae DSM 17734]